MLKASAIAVRVRRAKCGTWRWRKRRAVRSAPLLVASQVGWSRKWLSRTKCAGSSWRYARARGSTAR